MGRRKRIAKARQEARTKAFWERLGKAIIAELESHSGAVDTFAEIFCGHSVKPSPWYMEPPYRRS